MQKSGKALRSVVMCAVNTSKCCRQILFSHSCQSNTDIYSGHHRFDAGFMQTFYCYCYVLQQILQFF